MVRNRRYLCRNFHRHYAFADLLNYILSQSHWHNEYTIGGNQFPIMKNYLAIMINPSRFRDNITSDVLTRANKRKLSNLYAWCENTDGNMIISNELLPLESARRYCEGSDFWKKRFHICANQGWPGVFPNYTKVYVGYTSKNVLIATFESMNRKKWIFVDSKVWQKASQFND